MLTQRLHQAVAAACPIAGVSIGVRADRSTWGFDPLPGATPQQLAAAQAAIDAFDDSPEAQAAWEEAQKPERRDLRQAAQQAVADIDAYLALASPTNAQNLAQIRTLSRAVKRLVLWAAKQE